MLQPFAVMLSPYDPAWPVTASQLGLQLHVLGANLLTVEHIGSTAVPGLAAKPIIDLMPLVADLALLDEGRRRVEELGYVWHGELGIAGRRYCTLQDKRGTRLAQLHFFEAGSAHAMRHIAFRDYLRALPHIADAYAQEKRRAHQLHPDNSHAYGDEKSAWVEAMERHAIAWFSAREQTGQSSIGP